MSESKPKKEDPLEKLKLRAASAALSRKAGVGLGGSLVRVLKTPKKKGK